MNNIIILVYHLCDFWHSCGVTSWHSSRWILTPFSVSNYGTLSFWSPDSSQLSNKHTNRSKSCKTRVNSAKSVSTLWKDSLSAALCFTDSFVVVCVALYMYKRFFFHMCMLCSTCVVFRFLMKVILKFNTSPDEGLLLHLMFLNFVNSLAFFNQTFVFLHATDLIPKLSKVPPCFGHFFLWYFKYNTFPLKISLF